MVAAVVVAVVLVFVVGMVAVTGVDVVGVTVTAVGGRWLCFEGALARLQLKHDLLGRSHRDGVRPALVKGV